MLLKFFINSHSTAYLRGMAEEFGESTNAVRHELNNLSKAGYLISSENGRTIVYRANTQHPLYEEVRNLIHKYLGIDKIIDNILSRIGFLQAAFIVGDYAHGKDSGTIEMVLVGELDAKYVTRLVDKAKKLIHRNISVSLMSPGEFETKSSQFESALMLWGTPGAGGKSASRQTQKAVRSLSEQRKNKTD